PKGGKTGTQGQAPNSPQWEGVQGAGSNTLHGRERSRGSTAAAGRMPASTATTAHRHALARNADLIGVTEAGRTSIVTQYRSTRPALPALIAAPILWTLRPTTGS